jgi:hypothetical protein
MQPEKLDISTSLPSTIFEKYYERYTMKLINVSTETFPDLFAIVDDCDSSNLSKYNWYALKRKDTYYAARVERVRGKQKEIRMHRQILGCDSPHIDHIDGNGLHNWRSNLRPCENWQNAGNRRLHSSNTSGFRGVGWDKQKSRWIARLFTKKKTIHLGTFICPTRAAIAYDQAAMEYFGEFYKPQVIKAAVLCKLGEKK